jgi:hypothetical protein
LQPHKKILESMAEHGWKWSGDKWERIDGETLGGLVKLLWTRVKAELEEMDDD